MTGQCNSGRCQCGAVTFQTTGELRPVVACHCRQCRRLTGNYMAATATLHTNFKLIDQSGLKWYRSSKRAKRGFCSECGSNLFWQQDDYPAISITAGAMDDDTDLEFWGHLFVGEKGHFYSINTSDEQFETFPDDYPVVTE